MASTIKNPSVPDPVGAKDDKKNKKAPEVLVSGDFIDMALEKMNAQEKRIQELEKANNEAHVALKNFKTWHSGHSHSMSEPYSLSKALGVYLGLKSGEGSYEAEVSNRLRKMHKELSFHQDNSIIIPIDASLLQPENSEDETMVKELRERQQASIAYARSRYDEVEAIHKAMNRIKQKDYSTAANSGGDLIQPAMLGEIIDLQRAREVFINAGAQEINLPANGRFILPRLAQDPIAYWVGEAQTITASEPQLGNVEFSAKKIGVLVAMNNEAVKFSSIAVDQFLRTSIAKSASRFVDRAQLQGNNGNIGIKGLITYTNIVRHTAKITGSNGDTFHPDDLALMEAKMPDAVDDQDPVTWVMRRGTFAALQTFAADAVSANDQAGLYKLAPLMNMFEDRSPRVLNGNRVIRSRQVANNREKGSATNLTYALLGHFPDYMIARMGIMEFLVSPHANNAFINDQFLLRGIQFMDSAPLQPQSFILCDQLVIPAGT